MQQFTLPFLLTLAAGLATGIGSIIAFVAKSTNHRLLSFSMGLSGGVMVYADHFLSLGTPVRITHENTVDSLNLTIAAGIGIHWFTHRKETEQ